MVRFHAERTANRVSKQAAASGDVFEATGLKKDFDDGQVHALRGVDLQIAEGELVAIVGPSGSGKTTLLQMLGALDRPSSGTLKYRGESLLDLDDPAAYRAHDIGFIFQAFHLLPTFTASENVQIPMFEDHQSRAARETRALELLKAVGLEQRVNHFPAKLSGGERQRVAIARSLANSPSVLLADEPTGNLDSESAKHVLDLLTSLQRERRMTLILVTHDLSVASRASRAIQMKDGQIFFDGDPANLSNTLTT
jgi:ABC-type lipoprotein export system ATPase subunit